MTIEKVTAEWMHDQVFTLRDHLGYPITMSQPDGVLGADLLPLSLIGCSIWGKGIKPEAVERAIRLTEEKYCSTFATLKPALEITSEFEINPE